MRTRGAGSGVGSGNDVADGGEALLQTRLARGASVPHDEDAAGADATGAGASPEASAAGRAAGRAPPEASCSRRRRRRSSPAPVPLAPDLLARLSSAYRIEGIYPRASMPSPSDGPDKLPWRSQGNLPASPFASAVGSASVSADGSGADQGLLARAAGSFGGDQSGSSAGQAFAHGSGAGNGVGGQGQAPLFAAGVSCGASQRPGLVESGSEGLLAQASRAPAQPATPPMPPNRIQVSGPPPSASASTASRTPVAACAPRRPPTPPGARREPSTSASTSTSAGRVTATGHVVIGPVPGALGRSVPSESAPSESCAPLAPGASHSPSEPPHASVGPAPPAPVATRVFGAHAPSPFASRSVSASGSLPAGSPLSTGSPLSNDGPPFSPAAAGAPAGDGAPRVAARREPRGASPGARSSLAGTQHLDGSGSRASHAPGVLRLNSAPGDAAPLPLAGGGGSSGAPLPFALALSPPPHAASAPVLPAPERAREENADADAQGSIDDVDEIERRVLAYAARVQEAWRGQERVGAAGAAGSAPSPASGSGALPTLGIVGLVASSTLCACGTLDPQAIAEVERTASLSRDPQLVSLPTIARLSSGPYPPPVAHSRRPSATASGSGRSSSSVRAGPGGADAARGGPGGGMPCGVRCASPALSSPDAALYSEAAGALAQPAGSPASPSQGSSPTLLPRRASAQRRRNSPPTLALERRASPRSIERCSSSRSQAPLCLTQSGAWGSACLAQEGSWRGATE